MKYSEVEQETLDLDWFAVDANGFLAHFASAGKQLPESVAKSKEDNEKLRVFFRSLPVDSTTTEIDSRLKKYVSLRNAKSRSRYLQDFQSMSGRGFYSYDAPVAGDRSFYFRVCLPSSPLNIADIPDDIASIVRRTQYHGQFSLAKRIDDHEIA